MGGGLDPTPSLPIAWHGADGARAPAGHRLPKHTRSGTASCQRRLRSRAGAPACRPCAALAAGEAQRRGDPAWRSPDVTRGHDRRARARWQRGQGLRMRLGQGLRGLRQGGREPGIPLRVVSARVWRWSALSRARSATSEVGLSGVGSGARWSRTLWPNAWPSCLCPLGAAWAQDAAAGAPPTNAHLPWLRSGR